MYYICLKREFPGKKMKIGKKKDILAFANALVKTADRFTDLPAPVQDFFVTGHGSSLLYAGLGGSYQRV